MDPQELVAEKWQIQEWQESASQFRQLGKKFSAVMIQPEQSLNVLREAVDDHLPWQAGRHLCELFDYGLIDGTEIAGKRKSCELRVLSPVWREKEIERLTTRAKGARRLGGLNQEPPDPEYIKSLQEYHERCKSAPAGKPVDIDSLIVRATWWRFILRELMRSEDYKTRLGTKVEQNFGTIVGMLEYWARDYSVAPLDPSQPFSGDSTEERLRLRLHTAARIQTVACGIVAELLESEASARSSWITIESEELQRQAKNNSDADSDAAQPTGAAPQTSDQPDETGPKEEDAPTDAASNHPPMSPLGDLDKSETVSGQVSPDPPKSDVEFLFHPESDGYFISAFGENGHVSVKDARGLNDVFRLLQSPNNAVEMLELQFGVPVVLPPGEKRNEQQMADAETVKQLRAAKTRLRKEIEDATDEVELKDSQRRLGEVTSEGRKMFDKDGRARDMNDQFGKPRSAIRKRLERAYLVIATAGLPKLVQHLKPIINADGDSYIYRPGNKGPEWQFSQNLEK